VDVTALADRQDDDLARFLEDPVAVVDDAQRPPTDLVATGRRPVTGPGVQRPVLVDELVPMKKAPTTADPGWRASAPPRCG
jgi:hypothetical protein